MQQHARLQPSLSGTGPAQRTFRTRRRPTWMPSGSLSPCATAGEGRPSQQPTCGLAWLPSPDAHTVIRRAGLLKPKILLKPEMLFNPELLFKPDMLLSDRHAFQARTVSLKNRIWPS
jgi:hypothetical protein